MISHHGGAEGGNGRGRRRRKKTESSEAESSGKQVGSPTHFYSLDVLQSRMVVKKCVSIKHTRLVSVVLDGVLGPLRPARHNRRCPCFSLVPEATQEASRGRMKGAVTLLQLEKPSQVRGVAGRNGREKSFLGGH